MFERFAEIASSFWHWFIGIAEFIHRILAWIVEQIHIIGLLTTSGLLIAAGLGVARAYLRKMRELGMAARFYSYYVSKISVKNAFLSEALTSVSYTIVFSPLRRTGSILIGRTPRLLINEAENEYAPPFTGVSTPGFMETRPYRIRSAEIPDEARLRRYGRVHNLHRDMGLLDPATHKETYSCSCLLSEPTDAARWHKLPWPWQNRFWRQPPQESVCALFLWNTTAPYKFEEGWDYFVAWNIMPGNSEMEIAVLIHSKLTLGFPVEYEVCMRPVKCIERIHRDDNGFLRRVFIPQDREKIDPRHSLERFGFKLITDNISESIKPAKGRSYLKEAPKVRILSDIVGGKQTTNELFEIHLHNLPKTKPELLYGTHIDGYVYYEATQIGVRWRACSRQQSVE